MRVITLRASSPPILARLARLARDFSAVHVTCYLDLVLKKIINTVLYIMSHLDSTQQGEDGLEPRSQVNIRSLRCKTVDLSCTTVVHKRVSKPSLPKLCAPWSILRCLFPFHAHRTYATAQLFSSRHLRLDSLISVKVHEWPSVSQKVNTIDFQRHAFHSLLQLSALTSGRLKIQEATR